MLLGSAPTLRDRVDDLASYNSYYKASYPSAEAFGDDVEHDQHDQDHARPDSHPLRAESRRTGYERGRIARLRRSRSPVTDIRHGDPV